MLDTIKAEAFAPYLNQPCKLSHVSGHSFDLVVDLIEQKALFENQNPTRPPFSVLLKGPLTPSFHYGTLNLEIGADLFLSDVYIERILPPFGSEPGFAYYQMIFN